MRRGRAEPARRTSRLARPPRRRRAAASDGESTSGRRRRRHLELGELREQQLDRLRIRALVHAVERRPVARGEQLGDRFVREDHELLDERVSLRLALAAGARDTAAAVELEVHLGRLDPQRAAREAATPQLGAQRSSRRRRTSTCRNGSVAGEDPLALARTRAARRCGSPSGRSAARRSSSGISTVTQSRSTCGRRLQRSSASSGGSIGATRPGT